MRLTAGSPRLCLEIRVPGFIRSGRSGWWLCDFANGVCGLGFRVFYHDHCFDGACSASLFTRFHQSRVGGANGYEYHGLMHRAGALFDESAFAPDGQNAIVDFKYSPSPRVAWWFDHHLSAFLTPADEAHFRQEQAAAGNAPQKFFDPAYVSCTGLIAHVASTRFGMDMTPFADLVHWANIVDGAKYESAEAAVEMRAPAMQLTMVIESVHGDTFVPQVIPLLTEMSLQQVLDQPFVHEQMAPLIERHRAAIELIRERSSVDAGVITFDITDQPTEGYNKFIPYYLHPEGTYNVGLSKSSFRTKVAVGTNPWTPKPASELVNVAAICERYGGGGHARVGAISFPPDREDEARKAAGEIIAELRSAE